MTIIDSIEELLRDPEVTEIMVYAPDDVWVERRGKIEPANVQFLDERHGQRTIERIVDPDGRERDRRGRQYYACSLLRKGAPFDGCRVSAIRDDTDKHWKLNIRKRGKDNNIDTFFQDVDYDTWAKNLGNYYLSDYFARVGISDAQIKSLRHNFSNAPTTATACQTSRANDNPPTTLRILPMADNDEIQPGVHGMQDDDILSMLKQGEQELRARGYRMGWHKPVKYAGVIYILVNPAFPSLVKIGYADDIEKRLRSLNRNSGLPDPYHCYATYRVKKRLEDLKLHNLIDTLDSDLRHTSNREFYEMEKEKAYRILYAIAQINGDEDLLQLNPLEDDFFGSIDDLRAEAVPEESYENPKPKLKRMTFEEIGIPFGAVLRFKEDPSVTVTVADTRSTVIMADGSRQKISRAVAIIKDAAGTANTSGSYQGAAYFSYEGELLKDRRARLSSQTEVGEQSSYKVPHLLTCKPTELHSYSAIELHRYTPTKLPERHPAST